VSPVLLENCVDYGDFFFANVTCAQINYCQSVLPFAACCVGADCLDDVNYFFCLHEGGTWYPGESCYAGFHCPLPPPPAPVACDPDALFNQALGNGYTWLFPSWVENNDYRWVDNYQLSSGTSVVRLHYWGFGTQEWAPDWNDCDFGGKVDVRVKFYETDPNSTLPPPAPKWYAPLCTYDTTAKVEKTQYWFPTLQIWIRRFTVLLPTPCSLPDGWLSVQEILGDGDCLMGLLSGGGGDNRSFVCDADGCEVWVSSIPSADMAFCLYDTYPKGACCDESDGSCADDVYWDECQGPSQKFYEEKSCEYVYDHNLCAAVPGACCDMATGDCHQSLLADCQGPNEHWLGAHSTCEECCVAVCPPDGIAEGEPVCGPGYVDTHNGGGNSAPPAFQPLPEGQVVCGRGGNYEFAPGIWRRDTDWYEAVVPQPAALVWNVQAEFRTQAVILGDCAAAGMPRGDANCSGAVDGFDIQPFVQALTDPVAWQAAYPDCNIYCVCDVNCDGGVDGFDIQPFVQCLTGICPPCGQCGPVYRFGIDATSDRCSKEPARAVVEPGTYWLFVSNYYEGPEFDPACGTPYVGYWTLAGAGGCVLSPGICELHTEAVCLALGGTYLGDGQPCPE